MQNNRFILAGLLAIALTACGGGGGDDDGVKVNQPTNGGDNATQKVNNVSYMKFSEGQRIKGDDSGEFPQLNIMNLDGRNLEIIPANVSSKSTIQTNDSNISRLVGANLSYARYGVISYKKDKRDYIFWQGILTQENDMPNVNNVQYNGYAVGYRRADGATDKGTSSFTAHFKDKKMTGTIKLEKFGTFQFDDIKIDKNTFEGTQEVKVPNQSLPTYHNISGGFYGAKAEEVAGGFFNSGKEIIGTFGAKKQSK